MTVACLRPVDLLRTARPALTAPPPSSPEYFERCSSKIASNFLRASSRSELHTGASPALMDTDETLSLCDSAKDGSRLSFWGLEHSDEGKKCHTHEECKRGAHLPFLGYETVDG